MSAQSYHLLKVITGVSALAGYMADSMKKEAGSLVPHLRHNSISIQVARLERLLDRLHHDHERDA